jgi:hypothetical protein
MGTRTERYGADTTSTRPAWATWLIVGLVMLVFAIGAAFTGTWMLVGLLAVAVAVCLVGSGIAALLRAR